MAAAAIAGGVFGAVTSYFSIKEKNKALAAQARFNNQKFRMTNNLSNFAQSNNNERAKEISLQILDESAEAKRDVAVQEREAVATETIRRGEGLTAGTSVQRSVDAVLQQGAKAKAQVQTTTETAINTTLTTARRANAVEQTKKVESFQNTLLANAQLAAQQVTGLNALFQIAGQTAQGAQTGASLAK